MSISNGASPELQKNILATIAYYDGMDYPLTAFEVHKYLIKIKNQKSKIKNEEKFFLSDVIRELNEYNFKRFIEECRGFYFLRGRKELVEKRLKRNKISVAKIKRLRKVIWLLRLVPFMRMIGVTGRLAMKNADEGSDWDILVVLKNGKIWTGRTLVTLLLQLLGKRRHGEKIKDRVCLNYFITDESLELITQDLLSASEYFFIWPIFDTGIFKNFQLKNSWIRDYKLNYQLEEAKNLRTIGEIRVIRVVREIGEIIFGWNFLEDWLSSWQSRKIMNNPKTNIPGSFIRANNKRLIFFPEPQGPRLTNQLRAKIEKFGL